MCVRIVSLRYRLGYMCAMKEDKFRSNEGSAGPFMGMDWEKRLGVFTADVRDFLCAAWPFRVTLRSWLVVDR